MFGLREKRIKKNLRRSRDQMLPRRGWRQRLSGILLVCVIAFLIIFFFTVRCSKEEPGADRGNLHIVSAKPDLDVQLLSINEYSRPGIEVDAIEGIVIHYTANPGASAQENRDYFENLSKNRVTKASSNFIVGLDGEIIQCVPTWEIAYASNDRNGDTVSIEVCHPDETGYFNDASYASLVQLTAWLCNKYGLSADQVIRHYDVTGKICPKYFVENEDAWEAFRRDVAYSIEHPE